MLINLHSHLEGRLRPTTASELATELGLSTAVRTDEDWTRALQLQGPANLTVYLAKVAASYPFFATVPAIERIACEAVEDAAADGVDYLELRFGPATHTRAGIDLDDVVRAVCDGVAEGTRRSGLPAGLVVAALRHHDPHTNAAVAVAAARHAGEGVVGFDLAGDELRFPDLAPFTEAFAIASAAGLGLTCHAAEAAPAHAARQAVQILGVSRIGHGAHIADDAETMRWAADAGVVIEICPTSNFFTGAIAAPAQHPAATFRDAGIPLVLGDDNPVQTQSPMSAERAVLRSALGFDDAALRQLDRTSLAAMFADDALRRHLTELSGQPARATPSPARRS